MMRIQSNSFMDPLRVILASVLFLAFTLKDAFCMTTDYWSDTVVLNIKIYQLDITGMDFIHQVMVDSCGSKLGCNTVELAYVDFLSTRESDSLNLTVERLFDYNIDNYLSKKQQAIAIYSGNTYFFISEKFFKKFPIFRKAVFLKDTIIKVSSLKYNCLVKRVDDESYDVIFRFEFDFTNENLPRLLSYNWLIEGLAKPEVRIRRHWLIEWWWKLIGKNQ